MEVSKQSWPVSFPFAKWYLDAVANGWQYTESYSADGCLQAVLPYVIKKKMGLSMLVPPPLSPRLGPFLFYPKDLNEHQKQVFERKILIDLVKQLPTFHYAKINWPYGLSNGLPWQQLGWHQSVRYSYVLELSQPLELIWQGFKSSLRNKIRKADQLLQIQESEDWRIPFQLTEKVFEHRKTKKQLSSSMMACLDKAAAAKQARKIWIAQSQSGQIHAAIWLFNDGSSAYNLLLGSEPALRSSGAAPMLLWQAIQWSKAQGLAQFDFEGSHLPGVEPFFRSFGGVAQPYFQFTKGTKSVLLLKSLFETLKK